MFLMILSVVINVPILFFLYLMYRGEFDASRFHRSVLAVRMLPEMVSDSEFEDIRLGYLKNIRFVLFLCLFLQTLCLGLLHFADHLVSLLIPLLIGPLFLEIYLLQRAVYRFRRRLLDLKSKYRSVDGERFMYIDLLASRLKNEKVPRPLFFLLPLLVNVSSLLWCSEVVLSSVSFLITFLNFGIYLLFLRMPAKVYSTDQQKNVAFNQMFRQKWTEFFLVNSILSSLFLFALSLSRGLRFFLSFGNWYHLGLLAMIAFFGIFPLSYAYRVYCHLKKEEERLFANQEMSWDVSDEDLYYVEDGFFGLQYCNPDNPALFVSSFSGLRQNINIGIPKGRWMHRISKIILCLALLFVISISLFEDVFSPQLHITKEAIHVDSTLYPYSLRAEEIIGIELEESLSFRDSLYKLTGTATRVILRGDFNVSGLGKVKVYVWKNGGPVIVIHSRNLEWKRLYFNEKNAADTLDIYARLKQFFPDR